MCVRRIWILYQILYPTTSQVCLRERAWLGFSNGLSSVSGRRSFSRCERSILPLFRVPGEKVRDQSASKDSCINVQFTVHSVVKNFPLIASPVLVASSLSSLVSNSRVFYHRWCTEPIHLFPQTKGIIIIFLSVHTINIFFTIAVKSTMWVLLHIWYIHSTKIFSLCTKWGRHDDPSIMYSQYQQFFTTCSSSLALHSLTIIIIVHINKVAQLQ